MSTQNEQIHELDKQLVVLQHEMSEVKKAIEGFIDRLESLFATQTELLNSAMPEFEKTKSVVQDLTSRVKKIEKRHELEDYKTARRARWFDFSLKNWKVLISVAVFVFGLYEGGRALYMAPSPKFNAHKAEIKK